MTRKNLSGDKMQAGMSVYARRLIRRIRRRASNMGLTLKPFKQIYGWETEKGPEWMATAIRKPNLAVTVWLAIGDEDIEEARRTCDEVVVIPWEDGNSKSHFGVSWKGNWPHKEKTKS
jgi:hypothetical protein